MYCFSIVSVISVFFLTVISENSTVNSTISYNESSRRISSGTNFTHDNIDLVKNETFPGDIDPPTPGNENVNNSLIGEKEFCYDNRGFPSVQSCVTDCQSQEILSKELNETRMMFKVLHLEAEEFHIEDDDSLYIYALNLKLDNSSYYLNSNKSVKVCLSLKEDLLTCDLGVVFLSYFEPRENEQMHLGILDKLYQWNEFYVEDDKMVICFPEEVKTHQLLSKFNTVGSILSAICLWLGILLSKFIPDLWKNSLLECHMVMLALGFVVQSCLYTVKDLSPIECLIIHAFLLFFFLSTFFWLNLHSFDLYQSIKTLKISKTISNRRFFCYSIIGWGLPLAIVILAVVAEEYIPRIQPGYKTYCHFDLSSFIAFLYYHGWMALSIFINVILFFLIVYVFKTMAKDLAFVNRNAQKQLFLVSVRLAIVMGFAWIFEVLSWAKVGGTGNTVIAALNVLVCFQGVFIFLVYVCRRKILKKILSKLRKRLYMTTNSSTIKASFNLSSMSQRKHSQPDSREHN